MLLTVELLCSGISSGGVLSAAHVPFSGHCSNTLGQVPICTVQIACLAYMIYIGESPCGPYMEGWEGDVSLST